jgi:hypothetical protein
VGPDRVKQVAAIVLAAVVAMIVAGCGEKNEPAISSTAAAPAAAAFPATDGGTLDDILADNTPGDDIVVSPAGKDYTVGKNRIAFGIFHVDGSPDSEDLQAAIYIAHGASGKAEGPFPARRESLATDAAFTSQTTATDPDAAKAVYVTDVDFKQPGEYRIVAVVDEGDARVATRVTSVNARTHDPIPAVGDAAPLIHTPTVDEVGDITKIDTRVPPDTMHNIDFADVVGKKPVVLVFATPALCQSRVCGPVVDVTEQVKNERPDAAAYIHMEIYNDNDPNKGTRPQLAAYNLHTEPWLFVIGSDGKISTRIEGAFSVDELNEALDKVS